MSTTPEQPTNVIDRLHVRMGEIYGHRWGSSYSREALDTWAKGLAGLTTEQIARGVNACVAGAFAWPPTLPEFRALCLTVPGLPSADDAADDALAIARRWKRPDQCVHPIVWHCLDQIGGFSGIDEDVLRKRFLRNFERACADLADGKPLAAIPQPLPAPKDAQPDFTSEQAQAAKAEALAKINAMCSRGLPVRPRHHVRDGHCGGVDVMTDIQAIEKAIREQFSIAMTEKELAELIAIIKANA